MRLKTIRGSSPNYALSQYTTSSQTQTGLTVTDRDKSTRFFGVGFVPVLTPSRNLNMRLYDFNFLKKYS
jgi:hypothetical protein